MAIRIQNLPKKTSDSLFQNISSKVETPSQLCHNAKHLELQLPDQESTSAQAIGLSLQEVGVIGVTNSQCNSSESGIDRCNSSESDQHESCGKGIEGQMQPVFLLNNPNSVSCPSHPIYNHSMAFARYPYADAYFGGLFTPYGQQAIIQVQLAGSAPTRIPLPLDRAEDVPIYVNAKQYNGILRRRQYRAKLEAQNKLVKSRKPYLHESRHLHALNRVRGSCGRFLSKKELQQPDQTFNASSSSVSDASCLDRNNSRSELENPSRMAEYAGSNSSCSDISSVSNNNSSFQQPKHGSTNISHRMGSMRDGKQHRASVFR